MKNALDFYGRPKVVRRTGAEDEDLNSEIFPTFPYISRITIRVLKHIWDLRSRLVESCRQQQAQTSWNDIKKDLCLAGLGGAVIKVNSYATGFFVNVI